MFLSNISGIQIASVLCPVILYYIFGVFVCVCVVCVFVLCVCVCL